MLEIIVLAGSLLAGIIAFTVNIDILGTSSNLFKAVPLILVVILVMILKAAANCFTIGSGLSAGFAGMLSSTMNTPVATAVITLELFGFAYSLPAGIASIIGFQVNRSNTLYDFALRERKTEYE